MFDYILFMDEENQRLVEPLCKGGPDQVRLFLDYAPELPQREVPNPYYGGLDGFEFVMDLIKASSERLLEDIRWRHLSTDAKSRASWMRP